MRNGSVNSSQRWIECKVVRDGCTRLGANAQTTVSFAAKLSRPTSRLGSVAKEYLDSKISSLRRRHLGCTCDDTLPRFPAFPLSRRSPTHVCWSMLQSVNTSIKLHTLFRYIFIRSPAGESHSCEENLTCRQHISTFRALVGCMTSWSSPDQLYRYLLRYMSSMGYIRDPKGTAVPSTVCPIPLHVGACNDRGSTLWLKMFPNNAAPCHPCYVLGWGIYLSQEPRDKHDSPLS